MQLETAYISDPTFLDEFFPREAAEARPYETSLYLKKQVEDWQLDFLAKTDLNDFTPQLTQLQTPGYQVEKMPELGYYRIGSNLWDNRLTWYSENRLSRVRAQFGDETPADRGFTQRESLELFGFDRNTSFEDHADSIGFPQDWRNRFDSRQEIDAPLEVGAFNVTPYAVGRFTAYDDDFQSYNGESDQMRLWGAVGTRLSTQLHRTYNVDSELLNLRGLRHVVEPHADVFLMASTFNSDKLPVYDQEVEGINEGAGLRWGMTNTLQTQRGGPGRWRTVDWIMLDTGVVLRSDDSPTEDEIGHFYSYRPEYSLGGDHFYSRLLWMVSDTFGVTGDLTYNLERDHTAQWRIGGVIDHTPRLRTFLNYTEIDLLDSRLLTYGFTYKLTTKYTVGFAQRLDFGANDSRELRVTLDRRLPRWRLRLFASIDQVDNEQLIGITLIPEGFGGRGVGFDSGAFQQQSD